MIEQAPKPLLAVVHKIDTNDKRIKEEAKTAEKHRKLCSGIYKKAGELFDKYGMSEDIVVGVGAGGGIIGFRYTSDTIMKTPDVTVDIGGKPWNLVIKQGVSTGPNYRHSVDKILIVISSDDKKKELFNISHDHAYNFLGKEMNGAELKEAEGIIGFVKKSLFEKYGEERKKGSEEPQTLRDAMRQIAKSKN